MEVMKKVVLINGKKQSKLSVFNRLTQFGDGLFETCTVKNLQLLFWSEHFARLEKGRQQLKINPVSEKQWLKDIAKALLISGLKNAVVKVILSRGHSKRGYGFKQSIQPTCIVIVSPIPEQAESQSYVLNICKSGYASNQLLASIKHCNRLEQILARSDMNTDECVMLDQNDNVISVTQGNIFAIKGETLLTPNLTECGIEGTRRKIVLEIATDLGLKIEVGTLTLQALYDCDEVFITNSVIGIKSVTAIGKNIFTQQNITQKLVQALKKRSLKRKNVHSLNPKKSHLKKIVAVILMLILAWFYWANTIKTSHSSVYHLPAGASIISVANKLERQDIIHSSYFLILTARIFNFDSRIKSGYYDISPNMSVFELLTNFVAAKVAVRKVVLIEGQTVQQYYQQLSNAKSLTSSGSLVETMRLAGVQSPYEGLFWPDTYRVNYGDSVASVFKRSAQILQEALQFAWKNRANNQNLKSADRALVLASLIEKETAHNKEKSQISGVFMRRLRIGMRLQTDPTVVYALGDKYRGSLSRQDLKVNSPYNTYRHKGLPPTAIGSVGLASLRAAMHPAKGDSLYFVAKKDGTHAFAKTYQQHKLNIKKYLK
ncbi:FIG004453: protein YceG like [uncultured Candidatus Thioglobus sp.]|nr:FIG004453: protein YceG like [uncultured Candidatus Thioglobus sp.]